MIFVGTSGNEGFLLRNDREKSQEAEAHSWESVSLNFISQGKDKATERDVLGRLRPNSNNLIDD